MNMGQNFYKIVTGFPMRPVAAAKLHPYAIIHSLSTDYIIIAK